MYKKEKMKKLWMLLFLTTAAVGAQAQTAGEWLRQKKTQTEYLLEQLAALRLYSDYVQQGYAVAREGLTTIGVEREGEYRLHAEFFRSLDRVSPAVGAYGKVAAGMALQEEIVRASRQTRQQVQASGVFRAGEVAYVHRVLERVVADGALVLEQLLAVTKEDRLTLGEEERLQRIDAAYARLLENSLFARRFGREARLLAASRLQERHDSHMSRILHGLTPDVP